MRKVPLCIPLMAMVGLTAPTLGAEVEQIDYPGFARLVEDIGPMREGRLLDWETFAAQARQDGALLLDTRSASAFAQGHIEGAVNLPFSDFTADKLRAVIGDDPDRPIYIYCNNNFSDNRAPVKTKAAPLALNIPTFINLVGYGYRNVWELGETVSLADPRIGWVEAVS